MNIQPIGQRFAEVRRHENTYSQYAVDALQARIAELEKERNQLYERILKMQDEEIARLKKEVWQ